MLDSSVLVFDSNEVSEFMITVACECYSHRELIEEAMARLPGFNRELVWGAPCTPDPSAMMSGADLVLVVSDKHSLSMGIDRISAYQLLEQAALLVYLQDDDALQVEEIPGLTLPLSSLAAGFSSLVDALFTAAIPPGLVCIEWVDTRHILLMEGQLVIEEARGPEPEAAIESAVARLKEHATGRAILGLQASVLCGQKKLNVRYVNHLVSRCRTLLDEDAALFIGIPHTDWPESEHYEVRLAAKIRCSSSLETCS